jgi:hypothetical protein
MWIHWAFSPGEYKIQHEDGSKPTKWVVDQDWVKGRIYWGMRW